MKPYVLFGLLLTLFTTSALKEKLRIIGGSEAFAGLYPYVVAIHVTTAISKYFCGGTLLGEQWVLTAGQCVYTAISFTVQLGSTKLNGEDLATITVATSDYIIHPNYNSLTLDNDIGLIKLRMPVEFSNYVRSVKYLPIGDIGEGFQFHSVGWGQISDDDGELSEVLQIAYLMSLSNEECRVTYGSAVTDNMMCASGNYNQGTCIGDTGGPLLYVPKYNMEVPYGIASFVSANGCESVDPSGFTRIYPFVDWIFNITGFK